jgi:hypothetical protein
MIAGHPEQVAHDAVVAVRRGYDRHMKFRSAVRHRLGYRGLILLGLGAIYICIGLAVLGADDYRPELVHTHLPILVRILLWSIPGLVAMVVAWDDGWQAVGFALLFVPPSERAVSYFVAVITVPTMTRVPFVLVYLAILYIVTVVASWPEPTEVQKEVADGLLEDPEKESD